MLTMPVPRAALIRRDRAGSVGFMVSIRRNVFLNPLNRCITLRSCTKSLVTASSLWKCRCAGACGALLPFHQARFVSTGSDAVSGASVVITDPQRTAKERDQAAVEMLMANSDPSHNAPSTIKLKDVKFTVPYCLTVVLRKSSSAADTERTALAVLTDAFDMVNQHLNHFNPNSEVSLVNDLAVGIKHQMSDHLRLVMECCIRVYRSSGELFDPATGPLIEFFRKSTRNLECSDTIPCDDLELYSLPRSFDVNLGDGTISRRHPKARLDLGGLNKGYTVDYVVERLRAAGLSDLMFEWGGDIRASGRNVNGQPWAVGIARPPSVESVVLRAKEGRSATGEAETPPPFLCAVQLDNEAICTSGDYENVINDPKHGVVCSIFDWGSKKLLSPSDGGLAQVSVKCYNAMFADALATACLVKRDPARVRQMLDGWRFSRNCVTNYVAYTRQGERVAHMHEIAQESRELRRLRISGSLPARVIVVGGGLAGLSAAIEAAGCGAQVILLEKEKKLGGNSAKATSGINGWGTRAQLERDVQDGGKYFERDTYKSGLKGCTDPALVKTLSVKSADAINWLVSLGVPLTVLSQLGGHSHMRTHRAPDTADGTPVPIGYTIMKTLENHIRKNLKDRVTVMTGVSVIELLEETELMPGGRREVRVTGVVIARPGENEEPMKLPADAVVLATGGFSNDKTADSLLREYAPHLSNYPTTNGSWATGDGVKLARRLGAKLVDMDKIQLHPTGLVDPNDPANPTKFLGPEALRGSGGILLNKLGKRFVNELDLRSVVSNAILRQKNEYPGSNGSYFAYCVLNAEATKLFGVNSLNFYEKQLGLFQRVENVTELAQLIGCEETVLQETLENYNECSTAKVRCPHTDKVVYPCALGPQGPYSVAFVTPSIHYTMGGCLISPAAEVLREEDSFSILENHRPIRGLFGAGEVTGGVHGGNRLGGNSLLECVVFGKIAGDRAATILQKHEVALSRNDWTSVVVRETRSGEQFGIGSCVLRFNLPGAVQRSGLKLGEFVAIRGEWDGQQLLGYYSPITLPDDLGTISLLVRGDKGTLREWISALRPGDSVEIKACGGLCIEQDPENERLLFRNKVIRKFGLIAGGTGVAPMLQIIRAAFQKPYASTIDSVRLIYASEDFESLTYRKILADYAEKNRDKFACRYVLNNPPEGWTEGVGFISRKSLQSTLQPPSDDLLVAICGPQVMQRSVKTELLDMGYDPELVQTVS
ncbi:putative NADH-dependent fumarate reductase [Trypanosoma vivax]|nr:putative NADH-dependent fumarate reductase [Trypanosoma vivax]